MNQMTDQEILEKAVFKARNNGWKKDEFTSDIIKNHELNTIIFSQDFLKAFFGEEMLPPRETWYRLQKIYEKGDINKPTLPAWKHHAQQLVLEENPLIYLEKYI